MTLDDLMSKFDAEEEYRAKHHVYAVCVNTFEFFKYTIPRVTRDWYYEVLYAWDRVWKGYDDRMVFALNHEHTDLMIKVLKEFKATHHGSPIIRKKDWNAKTETVADDCHIYWNKCLDTMIAGFEAMQALDDMTYGDKTPEERDAEEKQLRETWKKGMKMFIEHYQTLWD